ncbi:hypothetical protein R1sor_020059 [Riccia sorocarpa]|uniref:Uncharacterized protein n=1 Tax=Riccia sorocarpa TaxID=122646 RepID=A0ABD3IH13_9MARC
MTDGTEIRTPVEDDPLPAMPDPAHNNQASVNSPSVPSRRKTRVLSSSTGSKREGVFRTPIHSPIKVCLQRSPANFPGGSQQVRGIGSLRRCKRTTRQQRIPPANPPSSLPVLDAIPVGHELETCMTLRELPPPPSICCTARWKDRGANRKLLSEPRLVDDHELPILKPHVATAVLKHGYVTRSLFRDKFGTNRVAPAEPRVVSATLPIIGVTTDFFQPLIFVGLRSATKSLISRG